jgi:hypothetical protein
MFISMEMWNADCMYGKLEIQALFVMYWTSPYQEAMAAFQLAVESANGPAVEKEM